MCILNDYLVFYSDVFGRECYTEVEAYRGTMLKLPPKKRRYESHIEEINAQARAQGKSYGQLQAEKLLARLHAEMSGVRA